LITLERASKTLRRIAGAEDTMRDFRFEKAMPTFVRCTPALAVAVGLIFALETVPAVRAQVTIDMSKITCKQWVDREVGDPRDIAIWLSGYYHGKRGETTVDNVKFANEYAKEVRDYCIRNPETLVMQTVETLIERTR
jgi:acid stress chaperone HdeB